MAWKEDTQRLALEAAENYYDNVLLKGKYPGDLNRLPKDREEAIIQLAVENVGKLREAIPQNGYTDDIARKVAALDVGATSKFMFEFGEDPFTGTRKIELSKIIDNGSNKRNWYQMGPKEIEAQMYRFGYDPAIEGDKQKFLKEVAAFQQNYDRGNIVQNTIDGKEQNSVLPDFLPNSPKWLQRLGMAMNPTITEEAIRQSLTGDFNDSRLYGAMATDALAQGAMAVAPSFRVVASNPLYMGLTDALVEGVRQGSNAVFGYQTDPMAPFAAGMAAGTVPAGAQYIGGFLSKGATTSARPLARGFNKGLRGADDPRAAERDLLKQQLLAAREQSSKVRSNLSPTGNPEGNIFKLDDLSGAMDWENAAEKLRSLGFYREGVVQAQREAEMAMDKRIKDIKKEMRRVQTDRSRPKIDRDTEARALQSELDAAEGERNELIRNYENMDAPFRSIRNSPYYDGRQVSVEDVIGEDPARMRGGPVQVERIPQYDVETVLKESYDRPIEYLSLDNGSSPTSASYNANKVAMDLLRGQLPEKFSEELAKNGTAYKAGVGLGRALGGTLGRFEPALRANPLQPTSYSERVNEFKKSEWYKNLPENQKIALEKALKGEQ